MKNPLFLPKRENLIIHRFPGLRDFTLCLPGNFTSGFNIESTHPITVAGPLQILTGFPELKNY